MEQSVGTSIEPTCATHPRRANATCEDCKGKRRWAATQLRLRKGCAVHKDNRQLKTCKHCMMFYRRWTRHECVKVPAVTTRKRRRVTTNAAAPHDAPPPRQLLWELIAKCPDSMMPQILMTVQLKLGELSSSVPSTQPVNCHEQKTLQKPRPLPAVVPRPMAPRGGSTPVRAAVARRPKPDSSDVSSSSSEDHEEHTSGDEEDVDDDDEKRPRASPQQQQQRFQPCRCATANARQWRWTCRVGRHSDHWDRLCAGCPQCGHFILLEGKEATKDCGVFLGTDSTTGAYTLFSSDTRRAVCVDACMGNLEE